MRNSTKLMNFGSGSCAPWKNDNSDKGRTNAEKFNRTDKRSDTRTPLTKKERQIRQRLKSNERFNKTGEQRGMRTP